MRREQSGIRVFFSQVFGEDYKLIKKLVARAEMHKCHFESCIELRSNGFFIVRNETIGVPVELIIQYKATLDPLVKSMTIAHEMGHLDQYLDFAGGDPQQWSFMIRGAAMQKKAAIEKDAWMRGTVILREEGFTQWDMYKTYAKSCYLTYLSHLTEEEIHAELLSFEDGIEMHYSHFMGEVIYAV